MNQQHKEGWHGFLELCLASKETKLLSILLDTLLTPEEKENLAMRYWILKELLRKEKTQRQLAKELNVSIAKITRGSNALKGIDKKLLQFLIEHLK
jgi:TrpR family transcriptional regulator, trp operon repressor